MINFKTLLLTANINAQKIRHTHSSVKYNVQGIDVELQFFNSKTVRVLKRPDNTSIDKESLSVIKSPENVEFISSERKGIKCFKTNDLEVTINLNTGEVAFYNTKGQHLLKEKGMPVFIDFDDAGNKTFNVTQKFLLEKNEAIYGLGQLQNGKMNQRNQTKHLIQGNVENVVTFFQSTKGYGVFWDNYSPTTFSDDNEETYFSSEVGDCVDYYFMYGGSADGVIAEIRELTGQVPMFPLWTYGYWQSKERYKSQEEIVDVVRKYRELGVPLDGIIQDWQYWGHNYLWNAMDFLNPSFQEPQKMVDEIHDMNAHMIISIWSSFGPATKPYRDLNKGNMLFDFSTWPQSGNDNVWPPDMSYPSGVRVYDAYNPKARDIYWKYLNEGLFKYGIDGWWMDSTEPDHLDWKPEDMDTKTYLGSFRSVRNAYPLMTVGGVYENQRKVSSDKRVFILTRSGFAGQQRYGANVWSGDVVSSWDSFRNQITAGLNFSICGLPHWNSDIGGFFAGSYNKEWGDGSASKNPLFQELYVRWLQFGAFNPMMRSHGTDLSREIYHFGSQGEPIYDAIEKTINLRYSLLPYIYSTSWEVTNKQSTFMRALVMDFVHDKRTWDIKNQFMFGKSILVAPVVQAQYTPEVDIQTNEEDGWNKEDGANLAEQDINFSDLRTSNVYLPAGTTWYDFWTNKRYRGGNEITMETTIDMIPLFIKAGTILPIGPTVQYALEKKWDNLELRIYTGDNGSFTLYEDEFDNYNYEKGHYTEIPMTWNDKQKELTIEARKGEYNGMIENRKFTIVLQDGTTKSVDYHGQEVSIKL